MTHHPPLLALTLAFALTACGKSEPPAAPAPSNAPSAAPSPAAPPAPAAAPATPPVAPAAQGDPSTPLSQYQRLNSGQQILLAYWAVSPLPMDHERLAEQLFANYANERDNFKKRDMLKVLAPQIDAEIAKARQNKYYVMTVSGPQQMPSTVLSQYDFNRKSFGVVPLHDSGLHYFHDRANYRLGFDNAEQFQWLTVSNEEAARAIEALRADGSYRNVGALTLDVYFYVGAAALGETNVKAQIMKVRLLDKAGTVLAEQ